MSCQTLGNSCDTVNDCLGPTSTGYTCDSAVCLSNVCTTVNCTYDSDCGSGMRCNKGSCTQFACSKDSDCKSKYMSCSGGLCTSISCVNKCPRGSSCTQLADGTKVCVANTGLSHWVFILAIILCIVVGIMIAVSLVILKKTKKH